VRLREVRRILDDLPEQRLGAPEVVLVVEVDRLIVEDLRLIGIRSDVLLLVLGGLRLVAFRAVAGFISDENASFGALAARKRAVRIG
jgi:hypothetical protein